MEGFQMRKDWSANRQQTQQGGTRDATGPDRDRGHTDTAQSLIRIHIRDLHLRESSAEIVKHQIAAAQIRRCASMWKARLGNSIRRAAKPRSSV